MAKRRRVANFRHPRYGGKSRSGRSLVRLQKIGTAVISGDLDTSRNDRATRLEQRTANSIRPNEPGAPSRIPLWWEFRRSVRFGSGFEAGGGCPVHLGKCMFFDLAHPRSCDPDPFAHALQRHRFAQQQPESEFDDTSFPRVQ
jgi:hypothetical protein